MLGVTNGLSGFVNPTSEYPWSSVSLQEFSLKIVRQSYDITYMKIMLGFSASIVTVGNIKMENDRIHILKPQLSVKDYTLINFVN